MTEKEFLEKMTDIMDYEGELKMNAVLSEIEEWDSISLISYIAMVKASCGKRVNVATVTEAQTVADLYKIASGD